MNGNNSANGGKAAKPRKVLAFMLILILSLSSLALVLTTYPIFGSEKIPEAQSKKTNIEEKVALQTNQENAPGDFAPGDFSSKVEDSKVIEVVEEVIGGDVVEEVGNEVVENIEEQISEDSAEDVVEVDEEELVNLPPVADAGRDQITLTYIIITFDGSNSYDPDGNIVSYEWDFGDSENASGAVVTHWYTAVGEYNVTLTVTDDNGATSADICRITVYDSVERVPLSIDKELVSGQEMVTTNTYYEWTLKMTISNIGENLLTNVTATDCFPKFVTVLSYTVSQGNLELVETNKGINFTWEIGNLSQEEFVELLITICTAVNENGEQEFTQPGTYNFIEHTDATGIDAVTGARATRECSRPIVIIAFDMTESRARSISSSRSSGGPTYLNGSVYGTLTVANSPYIATGNLYIESGRTLTIEQGTEIRFNTGYGLYVSGALNAIGTESEKIKFTSNRATPRRGDWYGISFSSGSTGTLRYCLVEYAVDAVYLYYSPRTISYCEIRHNYRGIWCKYSSATITNNILTDNYCGLWSCAIRCDYGSNAFIANNTITNNDHGIRCDLSSPTIVNNTIVGGVLWGYYGMPAITLFRSSPLIMKNNLTGGSSRYGEATIRCWHSSNPIIIDNVIIGGVNTYYYCHSGVINCRCYSSPTVINSTLIAPGDCPSIYASWWSNPTTLNTTFDKTKVYVTGGSTLTVKWYLDVKVIDIHQSPVADTNVKVRGEVSQNLRNNFSKVRLQMAYTNPDGTPFHYIATFTLRKSGSVREFYTQWASYYGTNSVDRTFYWDANNDGINDLFVSIYCWVQVSNGKSLHAIVSAWNGSIWTELHNSTGSCRCLINSYYYYDAFSGDYEEVYGKTDSNGYVRWLPCTEYVQVDNAKIFYTPHNVTATKASESGCAQPHIDISKEVVIMLGTSPPVANAGEDRMVYRNDVVYFDGSASYDPDGAIVNYTWDFGDGSTGRGMNVTHTYTATGNYTVTLTVTDDYGATAIDTCVVTVLNRVPVAEAGPNQTVYKNTFVEFNASASYDPDGTIVKYLWYFGDGASSYGMAVTHTYASIGNYTVILYVWDDDNAWAYDTCKVTVLNTPPVIDPIENQTATVGIEFNLQVTASDPDGDALTFSEDTNLFDIDPATGLISFVPAESDVGTHIITITVSDGSESASTTFTLTVLESQTSEDGSSDDNASEEDNSSENDTEENETQPQQDALLYTLNITLRVAGTPGNTVTLIVKEDNVSIAEITVVREAGNPNEQAKTLTVDIYENRTYEFVLIYNSSGNGDNPVKITLEVTANNTTATTNLNLNAQHTPREVVLSLEELLAGNGQGNGNSDNGNGNGQENGNGGGQGNGNGGNDNGQSNGNGQENGNGGGQGNGNGGNNNGQSNGNGQENGNGGGQGNGNGGNDNGQSN
ncbi:MAG: PKD domain-containing protein, partial [Candidatus Thermoplasmatota archaeon]|nr:PKD domain-containing protein [Candidatus Thermoplasmatota archaeon]